MSKRFYADSGKKRKNTVFFLSNNKYKQILNMKCYLAVMSKSNLALQTYPMKQ